MVMHVCGVGGGGIRVRLSMMCFLLNLVNLGGIRNELVMMRGG